VIERAPQLPEAEHLRGLCSPLAGTRDRRRDTLAVGLLQRVGDRQREQPADFVVGAGVDQSIDPGGADQAARGVVHEHPVRVVGALCAQRSEAVRDRCSAARAAATDHVDFGVHRFDGVLEPAVVGREHDQDRVEPCHVDERLERVAHHRARADARVLLGADCAGSCTDARAGDEGVEAILHAGSKWLEFYNSLRLHRPVGNLRGAICFGFAELRC
jgi:hypothetical protein